MPLPKKSEIKIRSKDEILAEELSNKNKKFYEYLNEKFTQLGITIKHLAYEGYDCTGFSLDEDILKECNKNLDDSLELCKIWIEYYGYKTAIIKNAFGEKYIKVYFGNQDDEYIKKDVKKYKINYLKMQTIIWSCIIIFLTVIGLAIYK